MLSAAHQTEMLALMHVDTKKWAEVIKATGAKIQ